MKNYPMLTSPVRIAGTTMRNRIITGPCGPTFIPGQDPKSDGWLAHFVNKAKGGAGGVLARGVYDMNKFAQIPQEGTFLDSVVRPSMAEPRVQSYYSAISEGIHFFGSKAFVTIHPDPRTLGLWDADEGRLNGMLGDDPDESDGTPNYLGKRIERPDMQRIIDSYVQEARASKECGFDGGFMHMAYRLFLPARFLSPLTNHREDEFGGPIENRARFPLMIAEAIKKACGDNFILECSISGMEQEGGLTLEDVIAFAKLAEGKIDILQIRNFDIDNSCATNYSMEEFSHLKFCAPITEALHSSGCRTMTSLIGGCVDIAHCEDILEKGQADLIAVSRVMHADPQWGIKAMEGRADDVVPCIRCNRCHKDPKSWTSVCSVNPAFGKEHIIQRFTLPPERCKRIAVVGGGAAGMRAAVMCAERGHEVILFEKTDRLGGALNPASASDYKWTIRRYRDYLIRQVGKQRIDIRLNTPATPELIEQGAYDAVLIAVGGHNIVPNIPGLKENGFLFATDVLEHPELAKGKSVIIGGGEIGTECGMWLAKQGKDAFVIEMDRLIAKTVPPIHYRSSMRAAWEALPKFQFTTQSTVLRVEEDKVVYQKDGKEYEETFDTLILAAGMEPNTEEAFALSAAAGRSELIGDCLEMGNLLMANKTAYGAACVL
jgi:2,4-dienoyl-CoA reductase-like NADH-dependent reductase (Old Yellow Enzyme family)/NADPH-dependent 2,4-dienoyl-CoA reductase/sulfur reductase-like enzyme